MSQELDLPSFPPPRESPDGVLAGGRADLARLRDVPVELAVEIGRARMTVGETLELRPGSIVVLDRIAGEPVDLLVNGTPIARGEVVVIDEELALRVTGVSPGGETLSSSAGSPEANQLSSSAGSPAANPLSSSAGAELAGPALDPPES